MYVLGVDERRIGMSGPHRIMQLAEAETVSRLDSSLAARTLLTRFLRQMPCSYSLVLEARQHLMRIHILQISSMDANFVLCRRVHVRTPTRHLSPPCHDAPPNECAGGAPGKASASLGLGSPVNRLLFSECSAGMEKALYSTHRLFSLS